MKACIINIGNELLYGHTINTNAQYLAQQLYALGFDVEKSICIKDDFHSIIESLNEASKTVHLAVLTGGLGPTSDDITRNCIADFFHKTLIFDENTWQNIQQQFSQRDIQVPEINKIQAYIPDGAYIFENKLGTAPGFAIQQNHFCLIALPGVPFEMKHIFDSGVKNFLIKQYQLSVPNCATFLFSGISESSLAEILSETDHWLRQQNITLAYLPQPGLIKLKAFYHSNNKDNINKLCDFIKANLSDYFIANEDKPLAAILQEKLIAQKATLATAESCTGGYIAHLITSIPGSSNFFKGSIIAYSNEIKNKLLAVSVEILQQFGAVSQQTVEHMATEVCKLLNSDYSIAVSGIAGPDGETTNKPVGTVWIAWKTPTLLISKKYLFGKDRLVNIERTATTALAQMIKLI